MKAVTHHDYLVNKIRSKVANAICDREISWEMAYNALIAMDFFANWDDDEFDYRPVDESEIKECVWNYCFPNEKANRPLSEVYPFLFH